MDAVHSFTVSADVGHDPYGRRQLLAAPVASDDVHKLV